MHFASAGRVLFHSTIASVFLDASEETGRRNCPLSAKLDREIIDLKYMSPKGAKMLSDDAERRQHGFKISRLTVSLA